MITKYSKFLLLESRLSPTKGDYILIKQGDKKFYALPQDYAIKFDATPDGRIIVNGNIDYSSRLDHDENKKMNKLPFLFYKINGDFNLEGQKKITTTEGFPEIVTKSVNIEGCDLKSFKGCPQEVGGNFYSGGERYGWSNNISSLEGLPKKVKNFRISFTKNLKNLKFCPEIEEDLWVNDNKLISLEGCPRVIPKNFWCMNTSITDLKGGPLEVGGSYYLSRNLLLTSFEGIPKKLKKLVINDDRDDSQLYKKDKKLMTQINNIEQYPISIIDNLDMNINNPIFKPSNNLELIKKTKFSSSGLTRIYTDIKRIILENKDAFESLLDDKIKFHQHLMRLEPDLIPFYSTIEPPTKKSNLML